MAIYEEIVRKGKRIPTEITFSGDEMDQANGTISVAHGLRLDGTNDVLERGEMGPYDLATELAYVDSNGTTGMQVLQYLAEWFEHKRQA